VAHGVHKIAATRAANAGATVAQLEAIFGWQGGAMASLYTRAADRRRLAFEAMHKLNANDERSSMVAPLYPGANTRAKTEMKSNAKFFDGGGHSRSRTGLISQPHHAVFFGVRPDNQISAS